MTQDRIVTESEALEDVSTFFFMKKHFEAQTTAPAEWRRSEARSLLAHALDMAALMCGNEVLTLAYGAAASDDRKDQLLALADRLHWPAQLFAGIMPGAREDSFEALADECENIARGDAPVLMAKLPGYRKDVRLLVAKFQAIRWEAYLVGLGLSASGRQDAISGAFGQSWNTLKHWKDHAAATWGSRIIENRLQRDRDIGIQDLLHLKHIRDEHWFPALMRSGRIYLRQAGYAKNG